MALEYRERVSHSGTIKIAVPRLARIANFDDLDPLAAEPDVAVVIIDPGTAFPGDADVILLPGSKTTLADLQQVRDEGWDTDILAHHRRGGMIVGLCGGYQILGRAVADPEGIEGPPGEAPGLGLLDVITVLGGDKSLVERTGTEVESGETIRGYEMHIGRTSGPDTARPWLILADGCAEGAISADGRVMASYLHGIFAADGFRHRFLERLGYQTTCTTYEAAVEQALDDLAAHMEAHLDIDALLDIAY